MDDSHAGLPEDIDALRAALVAARAEVAIVRAQQSDDQAMIAHLKLQIEKLNRDRYGPRSERTARLINQLELQLEELEATATEDELAAEMAAVKTTTVAAFTRKRPARKPFPEHLARERVIVTGPTACLCCGSGRLRKLGEDVTETLESVPRQWKVIQHVREKFTCRDCEKISQAPAPFHVIPRGWAGPNLLAMILFEKFWAASAAQPPGRTLRQGGRADQSVDLGRPGRRLHGGADAFVQAHRGARPERRAIAWGRHHGPRPCQRQDRHRPNMGLRARRQAVRWAGAAGGSILLLSRSGRRASPGALDHLHWNLPGRRLQRLWQALRARPLAWPHFRSGLLGPRPTPVLHHGRSGRERPPQSSGQEVGSNLAPGAGGGPPDRCPVRDRADDQRPECRAAPSCPAGTQRAARRRSGGLDARAPRQALARKRRRQGHGLHAQALDRV